MRHTNASTQCNPYFTEVFRYTLENCSGVMSNLERKREEKMYKEVNDVVYVICYVCAGNSALPWN